MLQYFSDTDYRWFAGWSDSVTLGQSRRKSRLLRRIRMSAASGHVLLFLLMASLSRNAAPKTPEYSFKMNNLSLLNFDFLPCWVVIVLLSLEYDYIRPSILTGLHFIFRHMARAEEMKWGNVKPQETTPPLITPFQFSPRRHGTKQKSAYNT